MINSKNSLDYDSSPDESPFRIEHRPLHDYNYLPKSTLQEDYSLQSFNHKLTPISKYSVFTSVKPRRDKQTDKS
jgi:hypothetical protein